MEPGGDSRCVTGGWRRGGVNAISRWRICGFWDLHYWDRIRIRYSQNHWAVLRLTINFKMEKESNMSLEYILMLYVKYCRCPSDEWRSACSFSAVCKTRHPPIPACGRALTSQWVCVCVSVRLHVLPCLLCVCKYVAVFICLFVNTLVKLLNVILAWQHNQVPSHSTLHFHYPPFFLQTGRLVLTVMVVSSLWIMWTAPPHGRDPLAHLLLRVWPAPAPYCRWSNSTAG